MRSGFPQWLTSRNIRWTNTQVMAPTEQGSVSNALGGHLSHTFSGKPELRFSCENSNRQASCISCLAFFAGGERLLAFFMKEQVM
jgi:hypothetical protein